MQETKETQVRSLGERSAGGGNGNPLQYSCLKSCGQRSLAGFSPWGCKDRRSLGLSSNSKHMTLADIIPGASQPGLWPGKACPGRIWCLCAYGHSAPSSLPDCSVCSNTGCPVKKQKQRRKVWQFKYSVEKNCLFCYCRVCFLWNYFANKQGMS